MHTKADDTFLVVETSVAELINGVKKRSFFVFVCFKLFVVFFHYSYQCNVSHFTSTKKCLRVGIQ